MNKKKNQKVNKQTISRFVVYSFKFWYELIFFPIKEFS